MLKLRCRPPPILPVAQVSTGGRFLKGAIGSFARKKAQLADISCLLSLIHPYAQNQCAKFLIDPEE